MHVPLRSLLVAGLATAGLVAGGVVLLGGDDEAPAPRDEPFATTALVDYDTTTATVERGPFCDDVDPREVEAALGGEPVDRAAWANGEPIPVGGREDVGHEFGCSWTAADGTTARAWVFAPPVTPERAAELTTTKSFEGCVVSPAEFGRHGSTLDCLRETSSVAYRGLFGDAWLTCEVAQPAPAAGAEPADPPTDRAGRWCVGVIRAG